MDWIHTHTRDFAIHIGQFVAGESHVESVPRLRPNETRPARGAIVHSRDVNFVVSGEFHIRMPRSGTLRMTAGAGAYPVTQVGRMRITCVRDGKWLCLIPRDLKQRWIREIVRLGAGETLSLKESRVRRAVCVATGRVRVKDQVIDATQVVSVAPRRTGEIEAVVDTDLIVLSARGTASLKPLPHPDPADWPVIAEAEQ